MSHLKLYYFDGKGRAELSRLILAQSGIGYSDERMSLVDWPAKKSQTLLGQLPYLETETPCHKPVTIPQSLAIARYLAKLGHLAGKTLIEEAQADAIVDTVVDMYNIFVQKVLVVGIKDRDAAVSLLIVQFEEK